jgi:hypothetical protein
MTQCPNDSIKKKVQPAPAPPRQMGFMTEPKRILLFSQPG